MSVVSAFVSTARSRVCGRQSTRPHSRAVDYVPDGSGYVLVSTVNMVVSAVNALVSHRPFTRLQGRADGRLAGVRQSGQQRPAAGREHGGGPVNIDPVHRVDQQQRDQEREAIGLGVVARSTGEHEVVGRPRAQETERHDVVEGGVLQVGERGQAVGAVGPVADGELELPRSPSARVELVGPHAVAPIAGSMKSTTVRSTEDRAPRCSAISVGLADPRSRASTRRSAS